MKPYENIKVDLNQKEVDWLESEAKKLNMSFNEYCNEILKTALMDTNKVEIGTLTKDSIFKDGEIIPSTIMQNNKKIGYIFPTED